jgi:nicotinamide-nucleotide amidase
MQAEIIAIGDEILIGQTIDTNSSFIAAELNLLGIKVEQKRVIADTDEAIRLALDSLHPKTNMVFMTGGLGPTKDDITKKTLLEYFGGEMIFYEAVYENVKALFKGFNREPKDVHRQQAYVPSSCKVIINEVGTAPGMHFQRADRHYFSTPGVPYETEHLVRDKIVPWIIEHFEAGGMYHKTVLTQGKGESDLAEMLNEWESALGANLKLAYLPSPGLVRLRLTGFNESNAKAKAEVEEQMLGLETILGPLIFGENAQSLEEVVGISLKKRGLNLALAESCTGGYIGHLITSIPGSSEYFMGGVMSYSDQSKQDFLGVSSKSLENFGAVSEEVAIEMATGIKEKMKTDFGLATTGIAGPGGGNALKPVGTVWIAIVGPDEITTRKYQFGKDRGRNIRKTALMALDLLRKEVQNFTQ